MLKFNYGSITNAETKETKNITVNFLTLSNAKSAAIGIGLILLGTAHLCVSMFQNGANEFGKEETEVLNSLDLLR